MKILKKPRTRTEIKHTIYSDTDNRKKMATVSIINYSDGRTYRNLQTHNRFSESEVRRQLDRHSSYLETLSRKLLLT